MKKSLCVALVIVFCVFHVNAQTVDSISLNVKEKEFNEIVQLDSTTMDNIIKGLNKIKPRYKLYETDNTFIFIKLDTATGRVWLVQYGIGDTEAMTAVIDNTSLLFSFEDIQAGRFELYPTKNIYNFILLDTKWGNTYQVQWHIDAEKRMRVPIY